MSYRELDWMSYGRLCAIWDPASLLIATLANIHRDTDQHPDPYMPRDFHPVRLREEQDDETEAPPVTGFWQKVRNLQVFDKDQRFQVLSSMMEGIRSNAGVKRNPER